MLLTESQLDDALTYCSSRRSRYRKVPFYEVLADLPNCDIEVGSELTLRLAWDPIIFESGDGRPRFSQVPFRELGVRITGFVDVGKEGENLPDRFRLYFEAESLATNGSDGADMVCGVLYRNGTGFLINDGPGSKYLAIVLNQVRARRSLAS